MAKGGKNDFSEVYRAPETAQRACAGRIVHFVLDKGCAAAIGQHRPALVVSVGPDGKANLQVFTDGDGNKLGDHLPPMLWERGVAQDESGAPGTWHWPERE